MLPSLTQQPEKRRIRRSVGLAIVVLASLSTGLRSWANQKMLVSGDGTGKYLPAGDDSKQDAIWEEYRRIAKGGPFYQPMWIIKDIPGVEQPELIDADQLDLPGSTEVVGFEIDGQPYAFNLTPMRRIAQHIVNLHVNNTAVSVTYCDSVDCVRVLSGQRASAIPLRVGGMDVDHQLVVILGEERYGQESKHLPFADYPFTRTSLAGWQRAHPHTLIFNGMPDLKADL